MKRFLSLSLQSASQLTGIEENVKITECKNEKEAIYDLQGKMVNGKWSDGKWSGGELPRGIYLINGKLYQKR